MAVGADDMAVRADDMRVAPLVAAAFADGDDVVNLQVEAWLAAALAPALGPRSAWRLMRKTAIASITATALLATSTARVATSTARVAPATADA